MKKLKRLVVLITGFMAVCGCNPSDTVQKIETRPDLYGKLLKSDGKTPAKGAMVTLQSHYATAPILGSATSKKIADKLITFTSDDGYFCIDSCEKGLYVLEATDESGEAARIDSVIISDTTTSTEISAYLLKKTGEVTGRILLDAGGDPGNIFVLAFGSDRFVQADSNGYFLMGNLPYGNYELKILCLLEEYNTCKTVAVTVLPDSSVDAGEFTLNAKGTCIPQNLSLTYDSINHKVYLQWDPCESSANNGYNVYRSYPNSDIYPDSPVNLSIITNSFFVDSTIFPKKSYLYSVAAVAGDGTVGRKSNYQRVLTSVSYVIDSLEIPYSKIPMRVYWKDDTVPLALFHQNRDIVVIEYNNDYSIGRRTDIVLPFDVLRTTCMDNDHIYAIEKWWGKRPDSCEVYCFSPDGSLRFNCIIDGDITSFDVNNDTLFIFQDPSYLTKAYDTTGNLLFTINDYAKTKEVVFPLCASDGNVYTNHLINDMTEIRKCNFETGEQIPCIFSTGIQHPTLIDANKNLFLISEFTFIPNTSSDVKVVNSSGKVLYTFKEYPFGSSVVINSRGQILMIKNDRVWLLTLPIDVYVK